MDVVVCIQLEVFVWIWPSSVGCLSNQSVSYLLIHWKTDNGIYRPSSQLYRYKMGYINENLLRASKKRHLRNPIYTLHLQKENVHSFYHFECGLYHKWCSYGKGVTYLMVKICCPFWLFSSSWFVVIRQYLNYFFALCFRDFVMCPVPIAPWDRFFPLGWHGSGLMLSSMQINTLELLQNTTFCHHPGWILVSTLPCLCYHVHQ